MITMQFARIVLLCATPGAKGEGHFPIGYSMFLLILQIVIYNTIHQHFTLLEKSRVRLEK